jgi:enoyl-[acyl-carrier-protein] reductase (NADH)
MMRTMTPTGRDFLSVDEMTGAAVFLACDDASAIHGATLMVDAGWSAWWTDLAARPLAPTMSDL